MLQKSAAVLDEHLRSEDILSVGNERNMVSPVSRSGGISDAWMHYAVFVLYTRLILMHLNFRPDTDWARKPDVLCMQSLRLGRCIDLNVEAYDWISFMEANKLSTANSGLDHGA